MSSANPTQQARRHSFAPQHPAPFLPVSEDASHGLHAPQLSLSSGAMHADARGWSGHQFGLPSTPSPSMLLLTPTTPPRHSSQPSARHFDFVDLQHQHDLRSSASDHHGSHTTKDDVIRPPRFDLLAPSDGHAAAGWAPAPPVSAAFSAPANHSAASPAFASAFGAFPHLTAPNPVTQPLQFHSTAHQPMQAESLTVTHSLSFPSVNEPQQPAVLGKRKRDEHGEKANKRLTVDLSLSAVDDSGSAAVDSLSGPISLGASTLSGHTLSPLSSAFISRSLAAGVEPDVAKPKSLMIEPTRSFGQEHEQDADWEPHAHGDIDSRDNLGTRGRGKQRRRPPARTAASAEATGPPVDDLVPMNCPSCSRAFAFHIAHQWVACPLCQKEVFTPLQLLGLRAPPPTTTTTTTTAATTPDATTQASDQPPLSLVQAPAFASLFQSLAPQLPATAQPSPAAVSVAASVAASASASTATAFDHTTSESPSPTAAKPPTEDELNETRRRERQARAPRKTFEKGNSRLASIMVQLGQEEREDSDDDNDLPVQLEDVAVVVASLAPALLTDPRSAVTWLVGATVNSSGKLYVPKERRWPEALHGRNGYADVFRRFGMVQRISDTRGGHWHYWYTDPTRFLSVQQHIEKAMPQKAKQPLSPASGQTERAARPRSKPPTRKRKATKAAKKPAALTPPAAHTLAVSAPVPVPVFAAAAPPASASTNPAMKDALPSSSRPQHARPAIISPAARALGTALADVSPSSAARAHTPTQTTAQMAEQSSPQSKQLHSLTEQLSQNQQQIQTLYTANMALASLAQLNALANMLRPIINASPTRPPSAASASNPASAAPFDGRL